MNTKELQCQVARCRFQKAAEDLGQWLMRQPSDKDCPEWRKKYLELDVEVKRTSRTQTYQKSPRCVCGGFKQH